MQKIRIGTQMYVIKDGRSETEMKALIAKASKIKSPKQQRAAYNAIKCGRSYPEFKAGMSTADYVKAYEAQNTLRNLTGHYTKAGNFFQPLSTAPQFAQSGEVIEEVMA